MTKVTMPDPVAWAHFTRDGLIQIWSRQKTDVDSLERIKGKQPDALITTTQAQAYKDACVKAALEEAYSTVRDLEKKLLTECPHASAPGAANFAANQILALIRALIPSTPA